MRVLTRVLVGGAVVVSGCGAGSDDSTSAATVSGAAPAAPANAPVAAAQSVPNAQMQAVLDQLAALGTKPIYTLTVTQARTQPGPPYAVKARLLKQGKSTAPERVGSLVDRTFPGPAACDCDYGRH